MSYDIESMQRWSNDPRTVALHHLLHRVRVELAVRTFDPGFSSRPRRFRSEAYSDAWDLGFSDGWRDQKPSGLQLTKVTTAAYQAGFRRGQKESAMEIKRICDRPSLAPIQA